MAKKTFCDRCEKEVDQFTSKTLHNPGNIHITYDLCLQCWDRVTDAFSFALRRSSRA